MGGENLVRANMNRQERIARREIRRRAIEGLDVDKIVPDAKDLERAKGLSMRGSSFYGNNSPFTSEATKMAKLIRDKEKLVRRAKAVVATWGTRDYIGLSNGGKTQTRENVWKPFAEALLNMGFSYAEVNKISQYYDSRVPRRFSSI